MACLLLGTHILTDRGEVLVENLRPGDFIVTLTGRTQRLCWIGHRHVDCRRGPRPEKVWPVRVAAGAFDENVPHRDLWLSPDHAVFVDDVLIPIKHLINGSTIVQVPTDEVTYYHIELPRHDVLLAEGLPAESYLDIGDRSTFVNSGGVVSLFPDFGSRTRDVAALWEAYGYAPLVITGPVLMVARQRVNERAAALEDQQAATRRFA